MKIAVLIFLLIMSGFAQVEYGAYSQLLSQYVCKKGVAYAELKTNAALLKQCAAEFSTMSPASFSLLDSKAQIAWCINAYNFFTVKLIVDNFPVRSIKDISKPWDIPLIPFEGKSISLNQLEHTVLRSRYKEPRIHCAINCASISCPALQSVPFTQDNLDSMLDASARQFLNDPTKNIVSNKRSRLSKIFDWYGKDFESLGGVESFLAAQTGIHTASIQYLPYNWNLNNTGSCH
jgi:hypothetical protein